MCLLFGGMGVLSLRLLKVAPDKAPRILVVLFLVFAAGGDHRDGEIPSADHLRIPI
jgi:cobalamin synthase